MKKYELTYIIHPDLEGSIDKITEKVKDTIKKSEGVIISEEDWGKRKLAYEIKKNKTGIYHFLVIEMNPLKTKELERTLRISEEIIRSMVVLVEEEAEVRLKPKETKKAAKKVQEKTEKPKTKKEEAPKAAKKEKAEKEKEEKERQKVLDEELKKIIGD